MIDISNAKSVALGGKMFYPATFSGDKVTINGKTYSSTGSVPHVVSYDFNQDSLSLIGNNILNNCGVESNEFVLRYFDRIIDKIKDKYVQFIIYFDTSYTTACLCSNYFKFIYKKDTLLKLYFQNTGNTDFQFYKLQSSIGATELRITSGVAYGKGSLNHDLDPSRIVGVVINCIN